jgi:hypothetical protein
MSNPFADRDPAVLGAIAAAVVLLLIILCCCCQRRRRSRIAKQSWDIAGLGYAEKISSCNTQFTEAFNRHMAPAVFDARVHAADDEYLRRRGAGGGMLLGPSSQQVVREADKLRKQVCEWAPIGAPIIDVARKLFVDLAQVLTKEAFLIHFFTEGHPEDEEDKHPVNPNTRDTRLKALQSCCAWRVCCVCDSTEEEALTTSEDLIIQLVAKKFIEHLGPNRVGHIATFAARKWVSPKLITVAQAITKREKEEKAKRRAAGETEDELTTTEMTFTNTSSRGTKSGSYLVPVLSCSPGEDAEKYAAAFRHRDPIADLYIRTCGTTIAGGRDALRKLLGLRADLDTFLRTLRMALLDSPVPDSMKQAFWFFRAVDVIDKSLASALYMRRAHEMRAVLKHWEGTAQAEIDRMLAAAAEEANAEALRSASYANSNNTSQQQQQEPTRVTSPSRISDEALREFLNHFLDAAHEQYRRVFNRDPDLEPSATIAQCCGHCLPEYIHTRKIQSGQDALREHLLKTLTTKAAQKFATGDVHNQRASRLLAEVKIDVLNRLMPAPLSPIRDDRRTRGNAAGGSDDDDDDEDEPERFSDAAGSPREGDVQAMSAELASGPEYVLPMRAYDWIPADAPPQVFTDYIENVEKRPQQLAEKAMTEISKIEAEVAVTICTTDPNYSRVEAVIEELRTAATPYVDDLAYVVTTYKRILRLTRDACLTARQGVVAQLARILNDLRELIVEVRTSRRFEDVRGWIPIGQVVRSFNVQRRKCPGLEALQADAAEEDVEAAPLPPPRDV